MVTMGIFFLKIICFVILSFHFICAFNVLFYIFLCSIVIIICIIKRAAAVVDAGVLMFYKAMCALEFKWTFHFFGNLPSKRLKTLGFTVDMKAFDTATVICWFGDTKKKHWLRVRKWYLYVYHNMFKYYHSFSIYTYKY